MSARDTRPEGKLHISRDIVDAILWFHVVGIDVRKPAYAAAWSRLEVLAVLVQQHEIILTIQRDEYIKYHTIISYERTCSFWISDTAYGLFGCTLGEVTEGQPF